MGIPQLAAQTMIELYREMETPVGFLANFFKPRRRSTGTFGTTLNWDSKRFTDKIAGTIDRRAGSNLNTNNRFSSKEAEVPDFAEAFAIDAADLLNRLAGQDPWSAASTSFAARFAELATENMAQATGLIDRSVELMAAQVLQTGIVSLDGAHPFTNDFAPKSSHFPTAAVAWSDVTNAVPLDNLEDLAHTIKTDSKKRVTRALFGRTALREFLKTDQVTEQASLRRIDLIAVDPDIDNRGASRYGVITVGAYEIELWYYDDDHEPWPTGTKVPYITTNKVILLPDDPFLTVGSLMVPQVNRPDPRVAHLIMPPTKSAMGYDLIPNVWTTPEGTVTYAGVRARVLMIPQGIDEFGCLTT